MKLNQNSHKQNNNMKNKLKDIKKQLLTIKMKFNPSKIILINQIKKNMLSLLELLQQNWHLVLNKKSMIRQLSSCSLNTHLLYPTKNKSQEIGKQQQINSNQWFLI
ncbi:hypothetical protein TTHERM_000492799 (macronuclear) [Tetrahymena thermophila SB210]|uniref:Uncharacterized protein n=1 Tax=Tetrahymena thermophila (strain SB210) TaxID=312017 RepID=W7X4P8_TETTS|nr:hypothetical protein TTHERM_000492799 [Tetrahymena thermophila SB210]EWS72387.1 hypothetical protein TTHERM_000492799 [Tetrahymena thermophila SB210]|eukprot:XP_012655071.1 hypothetical protein TTHERM_000492799 [Tetrahymena thermophila SB210]